MKQRLQAWGDTKILDIAACLIFDERGLLLLLRRHSDDLGGGQWGTPGGRMEPGETPEQGMLREIREETGLLVNGAERLGTHEIRMPHGTVRMITYKTFVPSDSPIILDSEEHHAYAWVSVNDLLFRNDVLWGVPTVLRDFGLLEQFEADPTLADGSEAILLTR